MEQQIRHFLFVTIDNLNAYHDRPWVTERLYEMVRVRFGPTVVVQWLDNFVEMLVSEYCP